GRGGQAAAVHAGGDCGLRPCDGSPYLCGERCRRVPAFGRAIGAVARTDRAGHPRGLRRGANRAETLARMEQALQNFHALGVQTNIAYLLAILRHPAFRAGELSTRFLEAHFAGWKPPQEIPNAALLALAAEAVTASKSPRAAPAAAATDGDVFSPWRTGGAWRNV